jgi:hypothetical protein
VAESDSLWVPADIVDVACSRCQAKSWSVTSGPRVQSRGFLKGWNFVAGLRCNECGANMGAGWGGELGFRERVAPFRRRRPYERRRGRS